MSGDFGKGWLRKRTQYYFRVPTMFVDDVKLYEAHPGESYEECRENVRRVLEEALA